MFFCCGALFAILLDAKFSLNIFILGYLALFLAHLSVSYSNDYFDLKVDSLGKPDKFSGGSGILLENPQLREFSKYFSLILIFLSVLTASIITIYFQLPLSFLVLILLGNVLGWFYSAPPLKLSYRGLSEFSTVLTGFIVPGIGYVILMGKLDVNFIFFVVPLMLYELYFILNIEIPDMEADKLGGKKTFVAIQGRSFSFILIAVSAFVATLYYILLSLTNLYSSINLNMIVVISLIPLTFGIISAVKKPINRKYANKWVNYNLIGLSAFIILIDAYFIHLI
ncbi:MAG: prenyltransferase [Methanobacterium sp.]